MSRQRTRIGAVVIVIAALLAVAVAGVAVPGGTQQAKADEPVVLTITGNGQTKTFTMVELQALPAYVGYSGIINAAKTVTPAAPVKGVKLTDLFAPVGGIPFPGSVGVMGVDDYGMKFKYDEVVNGAFQMYGETSKEPETALSPVSLVLIYEYDGAPVGADVGPLRLAVCQESNVHQVAEGHLNVKWVNRLNLGGAVVDWNVKMYGLKRKNGTRQTYTLDRKTYDSCATPGCHGASWTDTATGKTWTGVPLFLCVGKVDGGKSHGGYGAYNEALALKGYRIKLVSTTGRYVVIGSRAIRNRDGIVLANKSMGSELTSTYYPLRLIGPTKYIAAKKRLGRLAKIVLLPR
jgi:hypothetical protein